MSDPLKKLVVLTEAWVGIVEDTLDIIMLVGSLGYIVLLNDTDLGLSQETMAAIGASGGSLRLLMRRVLRRVVEVRLGQKDGA